MLLEWILSGMIGLIIGVLFQDALTRFTKTIKDFILSTYYSIADPPIKNPSKCFSFGKRMSTVIIKDGDGRKEYEAENIRTGIVTECCDGGEYAEEVDYFLTKTVEEIEEKKTVFHQPVPWNGKTIALYEFCTNRSDEREKMTLDLFLASNDYYHTYSVITHMHDECPETGRAFSDYIDQYDFTQTMGRYDLPNSIGVCLQVFTRDYKTVFAKRSISSGFRPGENDVSVVEGFSTSDVVDGRVDIFSVARRGCREELCELNDDEMSVHFLGFFFDKKYNQWNIVGVVDLSITHNELIKRRNSGVDGRWELKELTFVNQNLDDIIVFLTTHNIWDMGLATAYYSLLYKMYGRKRIDKIIEKYEGLKTGEKQFL